jgi:hypothetical protein
LRSSDNASAGASFELDPFEPLGRLTRPFCWFGIAPTLFDAPSRASGADRLDSAQLPLLYHSRCGAGRGGEARALLGFSWGFAIGDGAISFEQPARLPPAEWDRHLALLRSEHPGWTFSSGYQSE